MRRNGNFGIIFQPTKITGLSSKESCSELSLGPVITYTNFILGDVALHGAGAVLNLHFASVLLVRGRRGRVVLVMEYYMHKYYGVG